jgi:general secretion pathway protein I
MRPYHAVSYRRQRLLGLPHAGFTLVEVLVALSIVAIALLAGTQAISALTNNAQRQANVLLAHLCAENALVKIRLSHQMPNVGDNTVACEQAGRSMTITLVVRPTPNPQFRRVEAQVREAGIAILQIATIVARY